MKGRLLSLALGILAATLLAELALRLGEYTPQSFNALHAFHEIDPQIGRRGRPGASGRFRQQAFDVRIEHDERGFRKHLSPSPPPALATGQVIVVGDSFVWGWGVDQGETVSDRLAMHFPERRVRNLGLSGSGSARQFALFSREVEKLGPSDVVLLFFYANDFSDDLSGRGSVRFDSSGNPRLAGSEDPEALYPAIRERLKESSYLFNLIAFHFDRLQGSLAQARHESSLPDPASFRKKGPERRLVRHYLERFRNRTREAGAAFFLVWVPGPAELGEDDDESGERLERELGLRAELEQIADSLQLERIDVLPALRAQQERGTQVTIPRDGHWNALGHAVVAESVEQALRTQRPALDSDLP